MYQSGPFRSVISSSLRVRFSNRWFRFYVLIPVLIVLIPVLIVLSSFIDNSPLMLLFRQKHVFILFAPLIILQFFGVNSCAFFKGIQQLFSLTVL